MNFPAVLLKSLSHETLCKEAFPLAYNTAQCCIKCRLTLHLSQEQLSVKLFRMYLVMELSEPPKKSFIYVCVYLYVLMCVCEYIHLPCTGQRRTTSGIVPLVPCSFLSCWHVFVKMCVHMCIYASSVCMHTSICTCTDQGLTPSSVTLHLILFETETLTRPGAHRFI